MEHTVAQREPTLFEISARIRDKQLEILEMESKLAALKTLKARKEKEKKDIETVVWNEVVFNKDLKNEAQRKAKYHQKLEEYQQYQDLLRHIDEFEQEISNTIYELKKQQIELDFLKRLYDIRLTYEVKKQEV